MRGSGTSSNFVACGSQGTPVTDIKVSTSYGSSALLLRMLCTVKTPDAFPTIFPVVLSLTLRKMPWCHLAFKLVTSFEKLDSLSKWW